MSSSVVFNRLLDKALRSFYLDGIKAMDIAAKVAKENAELKRLLRLASSEAHRPYPEYKYRFELEAEKLIGKGGED